jgi:hypothetical protein
VAAEPASAVSRFEDRFGLDRLKSVYRVRVYSGVDSLVKNGTAGLFFRHRDSSDFYVHYGIHLVDSAAGRILLKPSEQDGYFQYDYADIGPGLAFRQDPTDGRFYKTFHVCLGGLDRAYSVRAFPVPVCADHSEFNIVYPDREEETVCRIYSLSGALVRILRSGRSGESTLTANTDGQKVFTWDLQNARGGRVAPGIYLYYVQPASGYSPHLGKIAIISKKCK